MAEQAAQQTTQSDDRPTCEDCLSKQFISDQLGALYHQRRDHWKYQSVLMDVANVLGVKISTGGTSINDR